MILYNNNILIYKKLSIYHNKMNLNNLLLIMINNN